jgi:hypothetical protein
MCQTNSQPIHPYGVLLQGMALFHVLVRAGECTRGQGGKSKELPGLMGLAPPDVLKALKAQSADDVSSDSDEDEEMGDDEGAPRAKACTFCWRWLNKILLVN